MFGCSHRPRSVRRNLSGKSGSHAAAVQSKGFQAKLMECGSYAAALHCPLIARQTMIPAFSAALEFFILRLASVRRSFLVAAAGRDGCDVKSRGPGKLELYRQAVHAVGSKRRRAGRCSRIRQQESPDTPAAPAAVQVFRLTDTCFLIIYPNQVRGAAAKRGYLRQSMDPE